MDKYELEYRNGKYYMKPFDDKKYQSYSQNYNQQVDLNNYTEVIFPLIPPDFNMDWGGLDVPPTISFYINKAFTPSQVSRLKRSISGMRYILSAHFSQKRAAEMFGGGNHGSQLAECVRPYATKNFYPIWYKGSRFTNNVQATNFALDRIGQMIRDNGYKNVPPAFIDPINLRDLKVYYSSTVSMSSGVSLSFFADPAELDNSNVTDLARAGALLHTWLHRAGYTGPNGTTFLTTEIAMCVMRGNNGKTTTLPDSTFISLLT